MALASPGSAWNEVLALVWNRVLFLSLKNRLKKGRGDDLSLAVYALQLRRQLGRRLGGRNGLGTRLHVHISADS